MKQAWFILTLILVLTVPLSAQEQTSTVNELLAPSQCDHTSDEDSRFDHIRLLAPVKARYFDGKKIEWETKRKIGSAEIDETSVLDPLFRKEYSKHRWWVLYCLKDFHVYTIVRIDPSQIRKR